MTTALTPAHRAFTILSFIAVAGLTAGAFILSYDDLRLLAETGLSGRNVERFGRYYPLVYDGLIATAILALFTARRAPWWTRWIRWILLYALVGGAIAASIQNVVKGFAAIDGTALDAGVASAPWVAALLATWLWLSMFRQVRAVRRTRKTPNGSPEPEPVPQPDFSLDGITPAEPMRLPTAADFPNPYLDAYPHPVPPPGPAPAIEQVEAPDHEDAEDDQEPPSPPPLPLPVAAEPVRPPASLPTDVKLVGRPAKSDASRDESEPEGPRPDLDEWAAYGGDEWDPPSGTLRSGPTPPGQG
ncbi:hypothetical protein EDD29_7961 [Actinocorallia herbida]|uniref:DUF2637 domain-containing protein n=1 Tax=Actinocorallia herbida TaxID=58109 RepID=A0A3N1D9R7_9ACTN|nr:hypothetical protein [Actinocorallia herbida]ROO90239.1 hypothetical protein EDD29_7961 [Actinocorallia herbida]